MMEDLHQLKQNLQITTNKLEDITERSLPLKKSAVISDLNLLRKMIITTNRIQIQDVNRLLEQINKISSYINLSF